MSKRLILIGGGHAHMVTMVNLKKFIERGHQVTLIGPSEHHYYSGMGPGLLSQIYSAQETRFAIRKMVEKHGGTFIRNTVTRIDPHKRLVIAQDDERYSYDLLSCNTGSYVQSPEAVRDNGTLFCAKPIERLRQARQTLIEMVVGKRVRVAVIGGGAAAVEIAGNVWRLLTRHARHGFELRLFASGSLLSRFPAKVKAAGLKSLVRRGVEVLQNCPAKAISMDAVETDSGRTYPADVIFIATGVKPSPIFKASGLPVGPDGGLAVNQYLQCTAYPNIFGGGDCIYYQDSPLEKVGVYAVRQNPILFNNLLAALEGDTLKPFSPGGSYLLIFNMGDGTGILYKNGILLRGRLAFLIKDYIDRRFIQTYRR
ncbi:MAG: FAD-dependent oxidoreductase [Desulfobacteraceae bacterium]|jgi:NADH dehydrogenase FAD-containing subunit